MNYRTQTFHDLKNELNQMALAGNLPDVESATTFLKEKGVDPKEFKKSWDEYSRVIQDRGEVSKPGILPGRLMGRVVGETGELAVDIGQMLLPEAAENVVARAAEAIGEKVPDQIRDSASVLFDPYHGDGMIEPFAADVLPYLIPGMYGVKGAKLAYGVVGGLGRGATVARRARGLSRKAALASQKRSKRKEFITQTTGWGGAITLVDGPEEDMVTSLIEEFPEATELINFLAVNPDDPEALQQLQSLINNLMVEGALVGTTMKGAMKYRKWAKARRVAKAARNMSKSTIVEESIPVSALGKWAKKMKGKVGRWGTSRFGVDASLVGIGLKRIYAGNRSVSEANGYAEDLMRTVRNDSNRAGITVTDDLDELINSGLEGDQEAIQQLQDMGFEDSIININKLRDVIDDLSVDVGNDLVTGSLSAQILRQAGEKGGQAGVTGRGLYLNHAYRVFDDPSFEAWNKIDPTTKARALSYIKQQGVDDADLEWVLKDLLYKVSEGDADKGMKFLSDMSQKSNKPFLKRDPIDESIKSLMGEIRNPYKNFARTYEKLSVAKAEADYLKAVEQHLLKNNLAKVAKEIPAVEGVPGGPRLRPPDEAIER